EQEPPPDANKSEEGTEEAKAEGEKSNKPVKKGPMKLPKSNTGPTTKNTKDAAAETLKKYFGGR
ncbi:MAG: hypothetical protein ACK6DC_10915, partial [Planctomycetota bacterium]